MKSVEVPEMNKMKLLTAFLAVTLAMPVFAGGSGRGGSDPVTTVGTDGVVTQEPATTTGAGTGTALFVVGATAVAVGIAGAVVYSLDRNTTRGNGHLTSESQRTQ